MSENVGFSVASENVRFAFAAVVALILVGAYYLTSPDSAAQPYGQASAITTPE